MAAASAHCVVTTATPSEEVARRIATTLVEERLAACAQVQGPINSIYRWQGAIETAVEWYCHAKTRQDRYAQVERRIRSLHPYENPEILATPVVEGSQAYLRWLDDAVSES